MLSTKSQTSFLAAVYVLAFTKWVGDGDIITLSLAWARAYGKQLNLVVSTLLNSSQEPNYASHLYITTAF
jgi:hypothetical protein